MSSARAPVVSASYWARATSAPSRLARRAASASSRFWTGITPSRCKRSRRAKVVSAMPAGSIWTKFQPPVSGYFAASLIMNCTPLTRGPATNDWCWPKASRLSGSESWRQASRTMILPSG